MEPVRPVNTGPPPRVAARQRTLSRVVQARRRPETLPRGAGRAWINGREVGGSGARYGHLGQSYD